MGYDTGKLYEQALKEIEERKLHFIEDIICYLPCSKPTFYEHFPIDSNELNNIKEGLGINKSATKLEIREKLLKGEKASELIALYKLIGNEDDRKKLSQTYHDHSTLGEKINLPTWMNEGESEP